MTLITTVNETVERINKRTLKIIFFIIASSLCQGKMNCKWQLAAISYLTKASHKRLELFPISPENSAYAIFARMFFLPQSLKSKVFGVSLFHSRNIRYLRKCFFDPYEEIFFDPYEEKKCSFDLTQTYIHTNAFFFFV